MKKQNKLLDMEVFTLMTWLSTQREQIENNGWTAAKCIEEYLKTRPKNTVELSPAQILKRMKILGIKSKAKPITEKSKTIQKERTEILHNLKRVMKELNVEWENLS